jgi:hypothetical protein
MPSSAVPDAVGVAVVNLTPQEAVYVQNFANTLQQERTKERAWDRISGATGFTPNAAGATGFTRTTFDYDTDRKPTISELDRGYVPFGWTASYNLEQDRRELTAPNGAKYFMDRNSDPVELIPINGPTRNTAAAQAKREDRMLDPAGRFSGLELNDE